MTAGSLGDTHATALRRGLVDPSDATLVGVVRRPSPGFAAMVDENCEALGPPEALREDHRERRRDLGMAGLCEEEAHNGAWEQVGFERRYREALATDAAAQAALDGLAERLRDGEDLWLVCAGTTGRKRSHRTVVRAVLADRL